MFRQSLLACTLARSVGFCDFFLWGHLKNTKISCKYSSVSDLKVAICEETAAVSQGTLTKVL